VPCIVSNTDSGSITSELLVSFLKKMDELDLLPRTDGLKPFLLLDGHGSRLELPFLQYVNSPNHEWVVCIGVPYGTSYWQVGDSSEQNGSYKMLLTKCKKELVMKKQRHFFQESTNWNLQNCNYRQWGMEEIICKGWIQQGCNSCSRLLSTNKKSTWPSWIFCNKRKQMRRNRRNGYW